jgi:hypothetical protein
VKRITRWSFWLPAIYLAFAGLAALDMAFQFSGNGEASVGAWAVLFSVVPALLVAQAIGIHSPYMPTSLASMLMLVILQGVALLLIGVAIDALVRRKRSPE